MLPAYSLAKNVKIIVGLVNESQIAVEISKGVVKQG